MQVFIVPTPEAVAEKAADKFIETAKEHAPFFVMGVATGSSPVALYQAIARRAKAGEVDLRHASAFALDEYVGLPEGHPESYHAVIDRTVTKVLDLDPQLVHVPNGFATDLKQAARDYEAAISAAGGIDCQIVGIGANGHIGFNEPFSSLASRTRDKTLMPGTRADNARFFDNDIEQVPSECLTQGLGTIMDAKQVLMVAQGENKAEAIKNMIEGPVCSRCPASILQYHPNVVVVIDEAAASKIENIELIRYTE